MVGVMEDTISEDAASGSFQQAVAKEITAEATTDAWQHPRPGDAVTVEIKVDGARLDSWTRAWVIGSCEPLEVAGLDLDRCVLTMRPGERATVRSRSAEGALPVSLHLLALEHSEDLLGDGRVTRVTTGHGSGWATPQAGSEVQVRFSWRAVPAPAPAGAGPGGGARGAGAAAEVLLRRGASAASREAADLLRALLRLCGGPVELRAAGAAEAAEAGAAGAAGPGAAGGPVLRVAARGGRVLAAAPGGLAFAEARSALEAPPAGLGAASRGAREAAVAVGEGRCACAAEDWLPGGLGLKVLSDLRAGQRCLVRLAPELARGGGLPELPADGGALLEYDVEVLRIATLEDVSLGGDGGATKKVTAQGSGYERPAEGAEVTLRLEARDDASGALLVEEQEHTFEAASGRFCSAVDETVLTMKQGEACEVRCTDVTASSDAGLQLHPREGGVVVFCLQLLAFKKLDLSSQEEPERVAHCTSRKEVGTRFFQDGCFRRALRRYKSVTASLSYIDHWKDQAAKTEAVALRRVCHLNAAACLLKIEAWREAEESCSAVLQEQPWNVKALFRRGQALRELAEYREAEQCMRKVLKVDGDNREAAKMLASLRQSAKAEADQQRELLSRMARGLQKSGAANDATAEDATGVEGTAAPHPSSEQTVLARAAPSGSAWPWYVAGLAVCSGLALALLRRWHR